MDKVIIPKEVAEAIETLLNDGLTKTDIMNEYFLLKSPFEHEVLKARVNEIVALGKISGDTLMKALVIGYEVEVTPEEKIKKSYDGFLNSSMEPFEYGLKEHEWFQLGMRTTLNILGKKIKGVNTDA